ncbi:C39 family peptidase [Halovivax limisalsi]|uniref:C39 family peptidase n=1 Tax=Halovivax limisalsi TaxID=1453760 RepID=UPI001FFD4EBA|nr:C39 family peptidase [Halovivax limisalsi]
MLEDTSRRGVLKRIGAMGIGGLALASSGSATAATDERVTKDTAGRVARETVAQLATWDEYDDWAPSGVTDGQLYFGKVETDGVVEYVPRAWVFAIEDRGRDVGYITIDADQLVSPVLAFGRSTAPHRRLDRAAQVSSRHGLAVRDRFLYHGGVQFGVETTDRRMVDLRGERVVPAPAVEHADLLKPTFRPDADGSPKRVASSKTVFTDPPDWEGGTDDEISDVPNWTDYDDGGADDTDYGSGDDEWDEWDGCSPIAGSMAIGYHEGIDEWEYDEIDALIDRLHDDMNTDSSGYSEFHDIDNGISNYAEGSNSYNGNNNHFMIRGNIKDAVSNNNPPMLNMINGPYTKKDKGWVNGHSVTVVGYKDAGWLPSDFYHKVHNGYDEPADKIQNGNWSDSFVTRIKPE